nr:hypothetical protein [Tanacetum cinerariifolium]
AFAAGSPLFLLPPTSPAYNQEPLESSAASSARAPRGQCDFVDTVEAGQGLIRSPGHDGGTIARAANRAEDVGYDLTVTQMMRIHTLKARARIDTVEDTSSSC